MHSTLPAHPAAPQVHMLGAQALYKWPVPCALCPMPYLAPYSHSLTPCAQHAASTPSSSSSAPPHNAPQRNCHAIFTLLCFPLQFRHNPRSTDLRLGPHYNPPPPLLPSPALTPLTAPPPTMLGAKAFWLSGREHTIHPHALQSTLQPPHTPPSCL